MRPLSLSALGLVLALAACATPQQRCADAATRDLRVVDGLIAQSRLNLERGYGVRERTDFVPDWSWCNGPGYVRDRYGNLRPAPPRMCWDDRPVTRRYPVAIDLAAERRKLAELEAKRGQLAAQARKDVAECQALNPR